MAGIFDSLDDPNGSFMKFRQTGVIPGDYAGMNAPGNNPNDPNNSPWFYNNPITKGVAGAINVLGQIGQNGLITGVANSVNQPGQNPVTNFVNNAASAFTSPYKPAVTSTASLNPNAAAAPSISSILSTAPSSPIVPGTTGVSGVNAIANNNPIGIANSVSPVSFQNYQGQTAQALGGLNFTPQTNDFAVNARQQYTQQLGNLMDNYTNNAFNQGDNWGSALQKKSNRGILANQINTIAGQLTTNDQLVQNDINNSNDLNLRNITDQRGNDISLGNMGLTQQQNQINDQLAIPKTVADINSQNADANYKQIQAQTAQIPLQLQSQLQNISNGVGYGVKDLSPDVASAYLQSPQGRVAVLQATSKGMTPLQASQNALQQYQSSRQLSDYTNGQKNLIGITSPLSLLQMNQKAQADYKYDPNSGLTVSGTGASLTPDVIAQYLNLQKGFAGKPLTPTGVKALTNSLGQQIGTAAQ